MHTSLNHSINSKLIAGTDGADAAVYVSRFISASALHRSRRNEHWNEGAHDESPPLRVARTESPAAGFHPLLVKKK
jgi:hypothetical protein